MLYQINTSTIPMRAEASDCSEMTNELLYGECALKIDQHEKWLKVRAMHDGYEGWIALEYEPQLIEQIDELSVSMQVGGLDLGDQGLIRISPGSLLNPSEHPIVRTKKGQEYQAGSLVDVAMMYLNTPYLWGGRSIWGIDCSGLMQMAYRINGFEIARDAYQQAALGETISHGAAIAGDLAFFENKNGKITHVGLMTGPQEIIHASGRVRIDDMDAQGIIRRTDGTRSHVLSLIKRISTASLHSTQSIYAGSKN